MRCWVAALHKTSPGLLDHWNSDPGLSIMTSRFGFYTRSSSWSFAPSVFVLNHPSKAGCFPKLLKWVILLIWPSFIQETHRSHRRCCSLLAPNMLHVHGAEDDSKLWLQGEYKESGWYKHTFPLYLCLTLFVFRRRSQKICACGTNLNIKTKKNAGSEKHPRPYSQAIKLKSALCLWSFGSHWIKNGKAKEKRKPISRGRTAPLRCAPPPRPRRVRTHSCLFHELLCRRMQIFWSCSVKQWTPLSCSPGEPSAGGLLWIPAARAHFSIF